MLDEKTLNTLERFAEAVKNADPEKTGKILAFCEGAAWALTMGKDEEEKTA